MSKDQNVNTLDTSLFGHFSAGNEEDRPEIFLKELSDSTASLVMTKLRGDTKSRNERPKLPMSTDDGI
ncbi:MAG: hypothetical protein CMI18_03260 [Opitutaceae bacterium]|nr:hypothetical protein [Opitutaceae bacterium]